MALESHPVYPLVASLDASGKVVIWRATDTTLSDSQHLLFDLNFGFDGTTDLHGTHISWDPTSSLLYLKHSKGMLRYDEGN